MTLHVTPRALARLIASTTRLAVGVAREDIEEKMHVRFGAVDVAIDPGNRDIGIAEELDGLRPGSACRRSSGPEGPWFLRWIQPVDVR